MPGDLLTQVLAAVALLGSIASIVSFIFNTVQRRANRSLKKTLEAVVCIGERAAIDIEQEAETALAGHAAERGEFLRSIRARAQGSRSAFSEIRRRQLEIASREEEEQHLEPHQ